MKFNELLKISIAFIIGLVIMYVVRGCQVEKQKNEEMDRFQRNLEALNTRVEKISKTADKVVFHTKAVEGTTKDLQHLIESGALTADNEKWVKESKEQKNLISALKAEIRTKDTVIIEKPYSGPIPVSNVSGDSLTIPNGAVYKWSNDTGSFKYNAEVRMYEEPKHTLSYEYELGLDIRHKRNDDESIDVFFETSDPNVMVNSMNSYLIPPEKPKTKIGVLLDNNKKWLKPTSYIITALGGFYLGSR